MLKKLLKRRNKKGFTLIELIVVLVILAILAAAAIPTMMGYVNNARKSAYLANCSAAYMAAQASITEQMGTGNAITETKVKTAIETMVPELKGKVEVNPATNAADKYVVTATLTGDNPKATRVAYYKEASKEYVFVDYENNSTNVMDGASSSTTP